jgi:aquaporin related protein
VAVIFYRLIKFLEYETANPGADSDGQELYPMSKRSESDVDDQHTCELIPSLHVTGNMLQQ